MQKQLTLTKEQIGEIRNKAKKKMDDEFASQLEQNIQVDELLAGTDNETQGKELRKLLILAGIDLESELSNPEAVQIIQQVLKNFDPTKIEDQDDAVFDATMNHF